jgi:hypothetical protein
LFSPDELRGWEKKMIASMVFGGSSEDSFANLGGWNYLSGQSRQPRFKQISPSAGLA